MNEAIEALPVLGLGYLDRGYEIYGLLNHGGGVVVVFWYIYLRRSTCMLWMFVWICVARKDCVSSYIYINNMFWIG